MRATIKCFQLSETVIEFKASNHDTQSTSITLLIIVVLIKTIMLFFDMNLVYLVPFIIIFVILVHDILNYVQEESVMIIKDFGIQLKKSYRFKKDYIQFLGRGKIESIFVHEYIRGSSVRYCLAYLLHNENRLLLSFKDVYPGLPALHTVFRSCTDALVGLIQTHSVN